MLRSEAIAGALRQGLTGKVDDPLMITPLPDLDDLEKSGSAAVDLRLGCWFSSLQKYSISTMQTNVDQSLKILTNEIYIPFSSQFILHPRDFALAVTLEWVSIPAHLAGYIHGKSSWGRRGLIIATASVIHPGFKGCITLELTNLGEVPIAIQPGMRISQLCLHESPVKGASETDQSSFIGQRKPHVGEVKTDAMAEKLMKSLRIKDDFC